DALVKQKAENVLFVVGAVDLAAENVSTVPEELFERCKVHARSRRALGVYVLHQAQIASDLFDVFRPVPTIAAWADAQRRYFFLSLPIAERIFMDTENSCDFAYRQKIFFLNHLSIISYLPKIYKF